MRKTLIAGTVIATGALGGLAAVWPAAPVDYKPVVLSEAEILAEKDIHCTSVGDDSLKRGCIAANDPIFWKMSAIFRVCGQKTSHHLQSPFDDNIGRAIQEVELWRCQGQYASVNGSELSDWPRATRSRTIDGAWGNLRYHWQSHGVSRPLDFSRAMAHVIQFSLSK
ncbi:MAG: hypothetical protein EBQ96_08385 [Proteobacteria bacterium]|nr:hypothetical protein [Pseudomonadota bacterium]